MCSIYVTNIFVYIITLYTLLFCSGLNEEAANKTNELTSAVKELQKLLNDANQQYGELETQLKEKEEMFKSALEKKDICIEALKKELRHANELFKAAKQGKLKKPMYYLYCI